MKRLIHITCILILFILRVNDGFAQDPHFSQFYAAPTYLNPALAGETTQGRAIINNRIQWPSFTGAFQTYNFSYDHNFEELNSGLGFMITHDKAGAGALRFTNFAGLYAHRLKINKDWSAKIGFQAGRTIRDININNLVFGSQLYGQSGTPSTILQDYQKISYLDFGSGILIYSKGIWTGFSAHHLNQPNQSLLSGESYVPLKYSLHGGYRHTLSTGLFNEDVVFAFNYKGEGKFDQLDLGIYYDRLPMVFGIWYRGLPLKAYQPSYGNRESLIFLVGYSVKDLRVGYSYDKTISKLSGNTLGAHELSLIYELIDKRKKLSKRRRFVPCAKF